jgi:uncharacterized membrane protein
MQSTHPGWISGSAALLACIWPLSVHTAILTGRADWVPAITASMATGGLVLWALARRQAQAVILTAGLATVVAILAAVAPEIIIYAPPFLINTTLAAVFGNSMRPGRVPVITRFAQLEHSTLPTDLLLYTRRLTRVWTAFFAVMAAIVLILATTVSLDAWSTFSNVTSYLLVGILFVGEYCYRRRRFAEYRHATLIELARNVCRVGVLRRPFP